MSWRDEYAYVSQVSLDMSLHEPGAGPRALFAREPVNQCIMSRIDLSPESHPYLSVRKGADMRDHGRLAKTFFVRGSLASGTGWWGSA